MLRLRAAWYVWAVVGLVAGSAVRGGPDRARPPADDVVRRPVDWSAGEFLRSIAPGTQAVEVRARYHGGPDPRTNVVAGGPAVPVLRRGPRPDVWPADPAVGSSQSRHFPRFPTGPPFHG
jgi:hypothetical protein